MGVVSRYNKGKKNQPFIGGRGGERGRKRECERRKGGQPLMLFVEMWRCLSQTSYHDHFWPGYKGLVGSVGYNACHMLSNQYLMHQPLTLVNCTYFY